MRLDCGFDVWCTVQPWLPGKGGGVNSGKEADFKNPLGEGVAFGGPSFGPISRRFPVVIRKLFQQLMLKGRTLN